jgi:hypothetical protein
VGTRTGGRTGRGAGAAGVQQGHQGPAAVLARAGRRRAAMRAALPRGTTQRPWSRLAQPPPGARAHPAVSGRPCPWPQCRRCRRRRSPPAPPSRRPRPTWRPPALAARPGWRPRARAAPPARCPCRTWRSQRWTACSASLCRAPPAPPARRTEHANSMALATQQGQGQPRLGVPQLWHTLLLWQCNKAAPPIPPPRPLPSPPHLQQWRTLLL